MESQGRSVYLDYAATTPVDPRVVDALLPFMTERFGNPSSLYEIGRDAHAALEDARERVAACIGARHPTEIVFMGSGTESDNSAIIGIAERKAPNGGHLVISAFEHHAVLESARSLEKRGYTLTLLKPDPAGTISVAALKAALRPNTFLVSVMHGNNEIGTVQAVRELAAATHEHGALFHTDAAQTLGKIPFDVGDMGVDAASFAGHKIYAPKGTGVLYLRRGTPFEPLLKGGGQESKRRSGTPSVAGAVAFAVALELMLQELSGEAERLASLRDWLVSGVSRSLSDVRQATDTPIEARLPNIVSLLVAGVEGESILLHLDNVGISVSTGSACSSGSLEPSHVLTAVDCPRDMAQGFIRISFGRFTTQSDIDYFIESFVRIVERLRTMSPTYAKRSGS
ncbi:MAG: cysteine desulfurase NifS [Actinobacteria bacterium HGW-Actinobacteria-10]|jgi:cysteine desulfurase|nr:MAG: cysteine desulfurase NifS [Actinobacteria bacterium HGW-Actinobacteria-10]